MLKLSQQEIESLCESNGVHYHHHDLFDKPPYKDDEDLKNSVIVIYSEPYGRWQLGINEDGTIAKPFGAMRKRMDNSIEVIEQLLALSDSVEETAKAVDAIQEAFNEIQK